MTTDNDGPSAEKPSGGELGEDLRRSIELLFPEGDLSSLPDIAGGIASGDASWLRFRDEFESAVRDHSLTPPVYQTLTGRGDDYGDDVDWDWNQLELDLRRIWHAMAPDRPFPWDEPSHQPPYPADHPTTLGFASVRLAYTLKQLVDRGNPYQLERAVRMGIVPHVSPLLERAVAEGWFTPEVWAWMSYGWGTAPGTVTDEVLDHDLRRVWSAVFPDRPYPQNARAGSA